MKVKRDFLRFRNLPIFAPPNVKSWRRHADMVRRYYERLDDSICLPKCSILICAVQWRPKSMVQYKLSETLLLSNVLCSTTAWYNSHSRWWMSRPIISGHSCKPKIHYSLSYLESVVWGFILDLAEQLELECRSWNGSWSSRVFFPWGSFWPMPVCR